MISNRLKTSESQRFARCGRVRKSGACGVNSSALNRIFASSTIACILAFVTSLTAQTTFAPQGAESLLIGASTGDQVKPDVAISETGGYVVWQDSLADGDGFGIQAQWLDAGLLTPFGKFTVNEQNAGDQENPKVGLFADGAAVFVWQSRQGNNTDIHARFLGANRTFATGDILVNAYTSDSQKAPSVTVLNDGTALIAWTSTGQDGSMDGVFGQRFTSDGSKVGGEFQISQTTQYNQRSVSVAALSNGGFAAAWITENTPVIQSATVSNVNVVTNILNRIYVNARVFDATGATVSDEFQVNSVDSIASNPEIQGIANGGFSIAWTERNTADSESAYDVFMRSFTADGSSRGDSFRVNSTSVGSQYSPSFNSIDDDHMVVWTSLGQDGSLEGVFGQLVSSTDLLLGPEFQVNTVNTASMQIHPTVATDKAGKMIVVWTSFRGSTSFDLMVKRYDATRSAPQPQAPYVHPISSTSLLVSWPELSGFPGVQYRIYMDGVTATPDFEVSGNSVVVEGLAAHSLHTFRLEYQLANNNLSTISEPASGRTYGADADQDGLPDDWQASYWGSKPGSWPTNPNADSDGDGASNIQEFLAGTNPVDAASVLKSNLIMGNGLMSLTWNAMPGQSYRVETSNNLSDWTAVGEQFAVGTSISINLSNFNSAAFYRVVLLR